MAYYIALAAVPFNDRKDLMDSVKFRAKMDLAQPIAEELVKEFELARSNGETKHSNCFEKDGDGFTVRLYPLPDDTPIEWVNRNPEIFLVGAAFKVYPHEWIEKRVFCFSVGF